MTLPEATLFPQALLPLYIFEPRYRQMLAEALQGHRMFSVAMQKTGSVRETPSPVAGVGLIRVCVGHADGTSHLVLQGIARVELGPAVRYKPYRVHRVQPIQTPPCDNVKVDALMAKMRELLEERFTLGLPFLFPGIAPGTNNNPPPAEQILKYLDSISDPERAADWVSSTVLPGGAERQTILETVEVEARLRRLIFFLLAEIRGKRKSGAS